MFRICFKRMKWTEQRLVVFRKNLYLCAIKTDYEQT